jgi:hypothetical protein
MVYKLINNIYYSIKGKQIERKLIDMKKVVNIFSGKEMGYVKGLTFYNKNGATKTFKAEWLMINWLKSYSATIVE